MLSKTFPRDQFPETNNVFNEAVTVWFPARLNILGEVAGF
jgi:hypothetical protein